MMVGRDPFTEQHQPGPAVPLRHVAEDLIVRPVLFDYVENVLDRRAVFRSLVRLFSAAVNALRETLQPGAIPVELRIRKGFNTAAKDVSDVLKRPDARGNWRVWACDVVAPIRNEECFGLDGIKQSRGEGADGNHTFESNLEVLFLFHLEYRHATNCRKGHE